MQIHLCVVLWGFTAILGKLISLPAPALVWWRMLMVTLMLAAVPRVWRGLGAMSWRLVAAYAGIGVLITLHWLTFYGSIKLANASVAATCMGLVPVFLSVVEPLVSRRAFNPGEMLIGAAVVPGVALVVGGVPSGMRYGIVVGVVSAVLVAFFGALNKRLVEHGDPFAVTAIELGTGALLLTFLLPVSPHAGAAFPTPSARDALLLLTLSSVCTLLPFTLSLVALRHMSAFGAQLAVNLEPVYTGLIASTLLGERRELEHRFYLGVLLIVALALAYPLLTRRPRTVELESGGLVQ
jgi:drug/metabolite transporter (DMT)-like permease